MGSIRRRAALPPLPGGWPLARSAGYLAYPLYLLHPMMGVVLMPLWVKDAAPWPRFGMLLAATLLLTAVFFVVVEQPLERWRRRRIEAL